MLNEIRASEDADPAAVAALAALPLPGQDKKLIIVIRASSVRLQVVDIAGTIKEQVGESEGGR